jgi:hypothetical protein
VAPSRSSANRPTWLLPHDADRKSPPYASRARRGCTASVAWLGPGHIPRDSVCFFLCDTARSGAFEEYRLADVDCDFRRRRCRVGADLEVETSRFGESGGAMDRRARTWPPLLAGHRTGDRYRRIPGRNRKDRCAGELHWNHPKGGDEKRRTGGRSSDSGVATTICISVTRIWRRRFLFGLEGRRRCERTRWQQAGRSRDRGNAARVCSRAHNPAE